MNTTHTNIQATNGKSHPTSGQAIIPASYSYKGAAAVLGWDSDRRLREDKRRGLLRVQFLGHRTARIKRQELVRYAREYGYTIFA